MKMLNLKDFEGWVCCAMHRSDPPKGRCDMGVSYPMLRMTYLSRNFFVLSLFCVLMHVCKAKSAGL